MEQGIFSGMIFPLKTTTTYKKGIKASVSISTLMCPVFKPDDIESNDIKILFCGRLSDYAVQNLVSGDIITVNGRLSLLGDQSVALIADSVTKTGHEKTFREYYEKLKFSRNTSPDFKPSVC